MSSSMETYLMQLGNEDPSAMRRSVLFRPTVELRWVERDGLGVRTLQQKWTCVTSGEFEWLDVEIVEGD